MGETDVDATLETFPTPLSMPTVLLPETLHDSVAGCPAVIVEGVAKNDVMAGSGVGAGPEPIWTCWLAGAKPLADAVMIADPILMPLSFGAEAVVVALCGMKMFVGVIVAFEGSLLVRVMNTPPHGAAPAKVTWNPTVSPGATVTLAGRRIWPGAMAVPTVIVALAVTLPPLLVAVKV